MGLGWGGTGCERAGGGGFLKISRVRGIDSVDFKFSIPDSKESQINSWSLIVAISCDSIT